MLSSVLNRDQDLYSLQSSFINRFGVFKVLIPVSILRLQSWNFWYQSRNLDITTAILKVSIPVLISRLTFQKFQSWSRLTKPVTLITATNIVILKITLKKIYCQFLIISNRIFLLINSYSTNRLIPTISIQIESYLQYLYK